jgi:hypothetical protein
MKKFLLAALVMGSTAPAFADTNPYGTWTDGDCKRPSLTSKMFTAKMRVPVRKVERYEGNSFRTQTGTRS